MKKKNFVTLIMSTVGGILFALGMCMGLVPEWNALKQGIVVGAVGAVILLAMVLERQDCRNNAFRRTWCNNSWCGNVYGHGLGYACLGHCCRYCRHCSAALPDSHNQGIGIRRYLSWQSQNS